MTMRGITLVGGGYIPKKRKLEDTSNEDHAE